MIWKSFSLQDICSFITDGKHGDCKNENNSGYYFISAKDIYDYKINYNNARQITYEGFIETHRRTDLKLGDVLLTNSGTIGRLAIASSDPITSNTTFQKSVAVLKPISEQILPRFLLYSLQFNISKLINAASGAAQKNLLLGELRRFKIDLPEIKEQNRIVFHIFQYDDLIENNRRRIRLLEESARLLYREWFIHLRFPGHEHTKITNGIPEGWEKVQLKNLVTLNYGKALKADIRIPGDFPVYGSSGEVGTHNKAYIKGPGLVVGRKGNVGSVFWSNRDYWPIDTVYYIDSAQANLFLYYALMSIHFINTDVAVPGLNRNFAHSREITIPKSNVHEQFIEHVVPVNRQIEKLQEYNQKLTQTRDLLLPRLMSGKIAV